MLTIKDRILACMTERKINIPALAAACDVTYMAAKKWLNGEVTDFKYSHLQALSKLFEVNLLWLAEGKEPKYGQEILAKDVDEDIDENQYISIPQCNLKFSAGNGTGEPTWEEINSQTTKAIYKLKWFQERHINPKHCIRYQVEGDSMAPFICHHDVVLVDTSQTNIISGKVYCISVDGQPRVKRLQLLIKDILIRSDNPEYPTETLTPELQEEKSFKVVGRVIDRSGGSNL